jgi:hypothetical protein
MGVKDRVKAPSFVLITVYAIFNVFWSISTEVVGLSLHSVLGSPDS